MNKEEKKVIRQAVESAINEVFLKFEVSKPSKKTLKIVESFSKKIVEEIKSERKKAKKIVKNLEPPIKENIPKKVKGKNK